LAANFDQYRFVSAELQYVPLCATTEVGRVGVFFDKDSQDTGPFDRVELASYAHLSEIAPWAETTLSLPIDNVKRFMIDANTVDPKLVDLGRIGVVTYGTATNNTVGDLFIHYTVDLFEAGPAGAIAQELRGNGGSQSTTVGSVIATTTSNASSTTGSWSLRPGTWLVSYTNNATGQTAGSGWVAISGGAVLQGRVTLTATAATAIAIVDVSAPNNRIDLNFGVTTTIGRWNAFFLRVSRDYTIDT
jgi:hypothetical protein